MSLGLELQALSCRRGVRLLFSDLNLQVHPGQLLRVLGANGAGKTSLLRMACGLMPPTSGAVLWKGQEIGALREEFNRQLIYSGHATALKDDLTALENLQTACRLGGLSVTDREAAGALHEAGLRGRERAPARNLSQGQRRRVGLARLVFGEAALLWVLDEPSNALDAAAAAWLAGLVTQQLQRGGIVVLTSHQSIPLDDAARQVAVTL